MKQQIKSLIKIQSGICVLMFSMACGAGDSASHPESELQPHMAEHIADWREHYKIEDPFTKMTDNRGNGYEDLYGTRNFRVVLHGVYYRGGANNKFHRTNPRHNSNPLPNDGLKNLCEEGFSTSVYFYTTNFSSAPKQTTCANGQLNYIQKTATDANNHKALMGLIYDRIKGKLDGPIYGHCWNGWHASGLIAAMALRQFCDWTAKEAEAYWIKNTDGNHKGYEHVLKKLKAYEIDPDFQISAAEKALICPTK